MKRLLNRSNQTLNQKYHFTVTHIYHANCSSYPSQALSIDLWNGLARVLQTAEQENVMHVQAEEKQLCRMEELTEYPFKINS